MCDNNGLVEIHLNGLNSTLCEQKSSKSSNKSLFCFKDPTAAASSRIPYKQSLPGDATVATKAESKLLHSIFGGASIEFVPSAYRSPTDLSCLRQMYCPDCQQRLHVDDISYDRLLYCCVPIFPFKCLYKCAIERRQSGNKVLCKKLAETWAIGSKSELVKCWLVVESWKSKFFGV